MVCNAQMPGRLIANLENYGALAPADRHALEALPARSVVCPAGAEIFEEGETSSDCRVLLKGQAFRHKTLPDGRRQIMSFHAPGDIIDLQRVFLTVDYAATALTVCEVALVPRTALTAVLEAYPQVARAFWSLSLVEGAIFREWMVGMGRRSAQARIAHLLCEVVVRLAALGAGGNDRYRFPVTQAHLADALGLSVVHTNRVLQALRRERLIDFRGRELVVLDWPGLKAAGEFDAGYLQLPERAA